VAPDDVAQLYYTSGTTGAPKGVMLTHGNVLAHAEGTIAELGLCADDVWGHIAPMFHLADAWACFAITQVGGVHVMAPRFEAEEVLRLIAAQRITISNLIPTMLNLMVKHPRVAEFDLGSLRAILSGGAPIAPGVVRQIIAAFGCEYVQTYGLTETSPYLTFSLLHEHLRRLPVEQRLRYQSRTGRPCAFVELKVVDDAGATVPADDESVGEIWARG
jgi:acyl-CoA synthetase (AMP-forming)/AMP-acid ligase II